MKGCCLGDGFVAGRILGSHGEGTIRNGALETHPILTDAMLPISARMPGSLDEFSLRKDCDNFKKWILEAEIGLFLKEPCDSTASEVCDAQ